jgi:hypothetical protein
MDLATDQVAKIFANGSDFEIFTGSGPVKVPPNADLRAVFPYTPGRRDGIGTTHHEAGSLHMGTNAATSATNSDGRLHAVANTYIAGPALFPSLGSPNPMLTGVALSRRLVDRLVLGGLMPSAQPAIPDAGFQSLFAGTAASFNQWQVAGSGNFSLSSGELVVEPGSDLGLLYLATRTFSDFLLKLEFKLVALTITPASSFASGIPGSQFRIEICPVCLIPTTIRRLSVSTRGLRFRLTSLPEGIPMVSTNIAPAPFMAYRLARIQVSKTIGEGLP